MLEFLSVILKILFIVFFFGFCIFIHEFGHLIVALWKGLHVETFSIGMGPKLWGFKYKGVEYVVSWLPFGGFVSLPQLDPTDEPQTSDERPLPHASPGARAWTAFAGPLFNVLFGFLLATIMWGVGLWRPAPSPSANIASIPAYLPYLEGVPEYASILKIEGQEVTGRGTPLTWAELAYLTGEEGRTLPEELTLTILEDADKPPREVTVRPEPNPEWTAGLRRGDRVVEVNGATFQDGVDGLCKEYVYGNKGHVTVKVLRDGDPLEFRYQPSRNPSMEGLGFPFFDALNPARVAAVANGSPAGRAGIKAGDQLLALQKKNVVSPLDADRLLAALPADAVQISVTVARQGKELPEFTVALPPGERSLQSLGLSFQVVAASVSQGSPAEAAGLRIGDQFLEVKKLNDESNDAQEEDSLKVRDVQSLRQFVRTSGGRRLQITYRRDGEIRQTVLTPCQSKDTPGVYLMGVVLSGGLPKVIQHVNPWRQFTEVWNTTTRTLGLLFAPLTSRAKSLVTGTPREVSQTQVGLRHMSGPLGIIQALWYRLKSEGYRGGFSFIILISFSLAFMNLLPLPVLDGGHILFAALEAVSRRRMPASFFKYLYNTFAILLIVLMLYITLFDGRRIFNYSLKHPKEPPVQKGAPDVLGESPAQPAGQPDATSKP